MILLKSKKADEKYLSIWMFLIWAIIGVSIVLGVLMFYSINGDVRQVEAQSLADKLSLCLTTSFSYEEIAKSDFDIYSKCGLNQDVFSKTNFYYFNINITGEDNSQLEKIFLGGDNWKTECDFQFADQKTEDKFPQCVRQDFIVFDSKTNKRYAVSIVAASNQK